jgi:hypothetical protein
MEVLKSKRIGKIIHLRTSWALILSEELEDWDKYEPVQISQTEDNKIIIEQVKK